MRQSAVRLEGGQSDRVRLGGCCHARASPDLGLFRVSGSSASAFAGG